MKPKHNRCGVCGVVTSRYSHSERAGAVTLKIWVRDKKNGEQVSKNGTVVRCRKHSV
jgi:hypothetical protein